MDGSANIKKATYYGTTHPGVLTIFFFAFAAILSWCAQQFCEDTSDLQKVLLASLLPWGAAIFYAIKWAHSVSFDAEGILFRRFGIVYRKLLWGDIIQVGIAKEYKATKLTIVVTPNTCPKFDSQYSTTTVYVEQYRHSLVLLDATKENQAIIHCFYGEFDYHANHIGNQ